MKERPLLYKLLLAPEKGLGLWLGSVTVFLMFLACSYFASFPEHRHASEGAHTDALGGSSVYNPADLGGMSAAREDQELFWVTCFFLLVGAACWSKLVWLDRNPGIVDTREQDFDDILEESLRAHGAPPAQRYCRTTLVKKPIR